MAIKAGIKREQEKGGVKTGGKIGVRIGGAKEEEVKEMVGAPEVEEARIGRKAKAGSKINRPGTRMVEVGMEEEGEAKGGNRDGPERDQNRGTLSTPSAGFPM